LKLDRLKFKIISWDKLELIQNHQRVIFCYDNYGRTKLELDNYLNRITTITESKVYLAVFFTENNVVEYDETKVHAEKEFKIKPSGGFQNDEHRNAFIKYIYTEWTDLKSFSSTINTKPIERDDGFVDLTQEESQPTPGSKFDTSNPEREKGRANLNNSTEYTVWTKMKSLWESFQTMMINIKTKISSVNDFRQQKINGRNLLDPEADGSYKKIDSKEVTEPGVVCLVYCQENVFDILKKLKLNEFTFKIISWDKLKVIQNHQRVIFCYDNCGANREELASNLTNITTVTKSKVHLALFLTEDNVVEYDETKVQAEREFKVKPSGGFQNDEHRNAFIKFIS